MSVPREYSVLVFVPKVSFTHILFAVDLIFLAGCTVE